MTQNDVMQLLILKDVGSGSPTPSGASTIVEASDTYLLDGEIAVTNAHNIVLDASTVLTDDLVAMSGIKFIQRSGTELIHSDMIKVDNIRSINGTPTAAAVEQVSHIGYDGATVGTEIEAVNSKLYVVRVNLLETDITGFGQEVILNSPYKSDSTATQDEVALGVALAMSRTMRRQAQRPIKVEMLNSATVTAGNDFLGNSTVVNGASSFTNTESGATGDGGVYATSTAIVVGDYVRIGTVAGGTALTSGVYKVTAISGVSTALATITVDRPIEAATGAYAAGTSDIEVIPAATAIAADYGIQLTGIARDFGVKKYKYSKVSFKVGLDTSESFGDTDVTYTTAMSLGVGTYEQVAQLEYELLGNSGNVYRGDFMYVAERADAVSGESYDMIGINFYGDHPTEGIGATPRRSKQLLIAMGSSYLTTESGDIIVEILEAYTTIDLGTLNRT